MDKLRSIWQLAEYMFLTTDDKKPIAFLYGEWLTRHDGGREHLWLHSNSHHDISCHHYTHTALFFFGIKGMDPEVGENLLATAGKLSQPDFWPYVYQ